MDKPKATPKDFVLWFGAMASLYGGVIAFISLVFEYINKAFPNPVTEMYYYDAYSSGVSYEMATLIVLVPVFLVLMRAIRRDIAIDSSRSDIWVRRWALFLTLFISGASIVVDLIVLLNAFLQGEELTAGFLLKVLTVLLVLGLGFMHFLADLRGYWQKQPSLARMINYGVGLLVIITILVGFVIIGTPQHLRKLKQDSIRIQDLQSMQWQIVNYWQQKETLPQDLQALNDPISGSIIPVDPKTREPYKYEVTGTKSFSLCATFELEGGQSGLAARPVDTSISENWQHEAGEVCFERSIDPERYPPYPKTR